MKKTITLFLFYILSMSLFSQTSAYTKLGVSEPFSVPYFDKISPSENSEKIAITEADWLLYNFSNLEEYDTDFQYYVYGTIIVNGFKILLIERVYREETNHWAVYISENNRILSHLNIAYKNSEGFLYIESEITLNQIIIKETNDYSTPKYSEINYTIDESGFLKK